MRKSTEIVKGMFKMVKLHFLFCILLIALMNATLGRRAKVRE